MTPGLWSMKSLRTAFTFDRRFVLKWSLLVVVLGIAVAIDLWTKHLAEQRLVMGELREVLPFLYLQRTANDGVAFGLLGGSTTLIVIANIVAMLIVAFYVAVERRPLLGGIAGGMVMGLADGSEPSVENYFKKWRKAQSAVSFVVECDKDKEGAVRSAVRAAGGRVA